MEKKNVLKRLIEAIKKGWARLGEEDVPEPAIIEGITDADNSVIKDLLDKHGGRGRETPSRSKIFQGEVNRRKAAGYAKSGPTRSGRAAKSDGREIDD